MTTILIPLTRSKRALSSRDPRAPGDIGIARFSVLKPGGRPVVQNPFDGDQGRESRGSRGDLQPIVELSHGQGLETQYLGIAQPNDRVFGSLLDDHYAGKPPQRTCNEARSLGAQGDHSPIRFS